MRAERRLSMRLRALWGIIAAGSLCGVISTSAATEPLSNIPSLQNKPGTAPSQAKTNASPASTASLAPKKKPLAAKPVLGIVLPLQIVAPPEIDSNVDPYSQQGKLPSAFIGVYYPPADKTGKKAKPPLYGFFTVDKKGTLFYHRDVPVPERDELDPIQTPEDEFTYGYDLTEVPRFPWGWFGAAPAGSYVRYRGHAPGRHVQFSVN